MDDCTHCYSHEIHEQKNPKLLSDIKESETISTNSQDGWKDTTIDHDSRREFESLLGRRLEMTT